MPILHARAQNKVTSLDEIVQFGIVDKGGQGPSEKDSWIFGPKSNMSIMENTTSTELHFHPCIAEHVAIGDVNNVLQKAVTTLQIAQHIEKNTKSKLYNVLKMVPFMSAVASHFSTDQVDVDNESTQHKARLLTIVQSCGYKLCDVAADGNCCFSAVAFSLLAQQHVISTKLPTYFEDKQLPMQYSIKDLAQHLREKTVEEWQNNCHEYEGFLSNATVLDEAPKFLQDGYYHGELADTVILAMSNSLEIPIVVFSSALHHPNAIHHTSGYYSYLSIVCSIHTVWARTLQWCLCC